MVAKQRFNTDNVYSLQLKMLNGQWRILELTIWIVWKGINSSPDNCHPCGFPSWPASCWGSAWTPSQITIWGTSDSRQVFNHIQTYKALTVNCNTIQFICLPFITNQKNRFLSSSFSFVDSWLWCWAMGRLVNLLGNMRIGNQKQDEERSMFCPQTSCLYVSCQGKHCGCQTQRGEVCKN